MSRSVSPDALLDRRLFDGVVRAAASSVTVRTQLAEILLGEDRGLRAPLVAAAVLGRYPT